MINERKVRLMTKIAMDENGKLKEDIKLARYFMGDYIRLQVLKTLVAGTIAYLLIAISIGIYKFEYLIENAVVLDYKGIGKQLLGWYIASISVLLIATVLGYFIKYRLSHKRAERYFVMLRKLKHFYNVEDGLVAEDDNENEEE